MTPTEMLELKRQSRSKWAAIVADLETKVPELEPGFTCRDCGYCQAYGVTAALKYVCRRCPLCDEALCFCGEGEAYTAVADFYDLENEVAQTEALDHARVMLAAIEADIVKDEAALKKVGVNHGQA
jgi:hypothetical protein